MTYLKSMEENIPLTKEDIEILLEEENTHFYSLWTEHYSTSLSGRTTIWLMHFESSLRTLFGEDYIDIANNIKERIPYLIYRIKNENGDKTKARTAFLAALYDRINEILEGQE